MTDFRGRGGESLCPSGSTSTLALTFWTCQNFDFDFETATLVFFFFPDHRTFGVHRRRMQFMLPIMYKLGVIITLLFGLTVISLKGVTIGVILLMLSVTSIVAKISKAHHDTQHYSYGLPSSPWSSFPHDIYDRSSMPQPQLQQSPDKNIHVHVYTAPGATTTKSRPTFDFDGSFAPSDDSAGGVNWSYDAPTNTYYQRNRGVGGAPETTTYY